MENAGSWRSGNKLVRVNHCKIAECRFEQFPGLPLPQTGVHQHLGGRPWRCVLQRPSPGHTRQRHNQGTLHSVNAWSLIFLKFTLNPISLVLYYCYTCSILIKVHHHAVCLHAISYPKKFILTTNFICHYKCRKGNILTYI